MSLQYEFVLHLILKEEKPNYTLAVLCSYEEASKTGNLPSLSEKLPEHPFFVDEYWQGTFGLEPNYAGFAGRFYAKLDRTHQFIVDGKDHYQDSFSMRANIHGDCYGYHLEFLEWLLPYCETEGFLGYEREEFSSRITQYFHFNGELCRLKTEENPVNLNTNREYEID
ncbi:Hypothetical protein PBC10988_11600 [Planctomycetales bacterium 10988]|nr:Hypothetical protein PBC10988_11600 [Planctomycetales bacterium 10988]